MEREWLAYGHKFGDRCGHSSEDVNQRSPVFLQWLDCVHQLMRQFPCDFKFNEAFLVGTYNVQQAVYLPCVFVRSMYPLFACIQSCNYSNTALPRVLVLVVVQ